VSRGLEKLEKSLNLLKNYNQGLESPRVSSQNVFAAFVSLEMLV
jgi:hypothetical protein